MTILTYFQRWHGRFVLRSAGSDLICSRSCSVHVFFFFSFHSLPLAHLRSFLPSPPLLSAVALQRRQRWRRSYLYLMCSDSVAQPRLVLWLHYRGAILNLVQTHAQARANSLCGSDVIIKKHLWFVNIVDGRCNRRITMETLHFSLTVGRASVHACECARMPARVITVRVGKMCIHVRCVMICRCHPRATKSKSTRQHEGKPK